jgi:hypothetical protein
MLKMLEQSSLLIMDMNVAASLDYRLDLGDGIGDLMLLFIIVIACLRLQLASIVYYIMADR